MSTVGLLCLRLQSAPLVGKCKYEGRRVGAWIHRPNWYPRNHGGVETDGENKQGNMRSKWLVCTEDLDHEPLSKYRNYALIIARCYDVFHGSYELLSGIMDSWLFNLIVLPRVCFKLPASIRSWIDPRTDPIKEHYHAPITFLFPILAPYGALSNHS